MKVTDEKTLQRKGSRGALILVKYIFRFAFLGAMGFAMSVTRLPFDSFPLGIGVVAASADVPIAALVGAIFGNAFIDVKVYSFAAAVACVFRIAAGAATKSFRFSRDGVMIGDTVGTRICAAFIGSGGAAAAMYIARPDVSSLISGVFTVGVSVFSTVVFAFFVDGKYRFTSFFPIGTIGVFLAVSLALDGYLVFGISAPLLFAAVATLLISFVWGGAYGGVAGLLLGLPLGFEWVAILSLTGIAAGLFSAVAGSFAAEITSLAVYVSGTAFFFGFENVHIYLIPAIVGEALTAIPSAIGMIGRVAMREEKEKSSYGELIVRLYEDENKKRMEMLSKAMRSLSEVIGGLTEKFRRKKEISLTSMCRSVWLKNCADCPVDCPCHDIGAIPGDDVIENIVKKLMCAGGRVDRDRISEFIAPKCPKTEEMIKEINDGAAAIVSRLSGDDGVDILALDYEAMSKMLSDALAQSSGRYEPDKLTSEKVRRALLRSGFAAENLVVCGDRKTYVIATGGEVLRSSVGADDIRRICENVCRKSFKTPSFRIENGHAAMLLEADTAFFTECAGKQSPKRGEEMCGDSVSIVKNRDGYFYSFICDGMGSGDIAAATSKICRVFLEKMLECGKTKGTTLQMLNTFIRNKGVECYATVDLLEIDLMQGVASFIKSGATPSYVRRGKNIFKIESSTLPIGIIRELSAEMTEFELRDGDVIIICSDGVAQDFDVSASLDPSWFLSFIENEWTDDLSEMAAKMIAAAGEQNHRSDDMTVELIRVRKKTAEMPAARTPAPALKKAE